MTFVSIKDLHVRYGKFEAVKGISFDIPKGEIFGFIGPNGAGKSTTIKVLATLIRPTAGTAAIGGVDVIQQPHEDQAHDRLHARLLRRLRGPLRARVPAFLRRRLRHRALQARAPGERCRSR